MELATRLGAMKCGAPDAVPRPAAGPFADPGAALMRHAGGRRSLRVEGEARRSIEGGI